MTTQELKQYIDKVLGNNIRCLLPSYWWKRLFGMVVDKVDEVEQSTSQLIDSKVEEVKMPIVESVDELEKLELAKGRVAAVEKTGESATVKISDCYLSYNWEEDWDKYTIVKGVEEKDVIIDKDVAASVMFSSSKETIEKDALQVSAVSGIFYYVKWADNESHVTSLEEVNKALSSGKYRAIFDFNEPDDCFIDDYFTFYLAKPQPSLYIKGDSWERLAKESDVDAKIIFVDIYNNKANVDNAKAFSAIKNCVLNGKPYVVVGGTSRLLFVSDGVMFVENMPVENMPAEDICNLSFKGFGYNETIDGTTKRKHYTAVLYADGHVVLGTAVDSAIDSKLSDTSENAVQNKAIKAYVDEKVANMDIGTSDLATKEELEEVEEVVASAMSHTSKKIDDLKAIVTPNLLSNLVLDVNKSDGTYVLGGALLDDIGSIYYCSVTVKGLGNDLVSSGIAKGSEVLLFVLGGILNIDCIDHMGINKDGNVSHATYRISIKRSTSEDIIETATGFSTETIYTDKVTRKILAKNLFTDETFYEKEFVLADANI